MKEMENDLTPTNGVFDSRRTIKWLDNTPEQQKEVACLICGYCNTRVHPFSSPKRCECGHIEVDEEKSTDDLLYLKDHQPTQFTVTSDYKPKFKEKLMNMFKGKNNLC